MRANRNFHRIWIAMEKNVSETGTRIDLALSTLAPHCMESFSKKNEDHLDMSALKAVAVG